MGLGNLRWEVDVGADTTWARSLGELLSVDPGILARSADVAAEVGSGVATVAVLSLQGGIWPRALRGVADEHAEALRGRY